MSVRLTDPDALERLAALEGESWLQEQYRRPTSPYGFLAMRAAWDARAASEFAHDESVSFTDFMDTPNRVLYGEGGWARFMVSDEGIITLLAGTTRPAKASRALELGFDVRPGS